MPTARSMGRKIIIFALLIESLNKKWMKKYDYKKAIISIKKYDYYLFMFKKYREVFYLIDA